MNTVHIKLGKRSCTVSSLEAGMIIVKMVRGSKATLAFRMLDEILEEGANQIVTLCNKKERKANV